MTTIKKIEIHDWRYPTSLKLDGSDAVHKKPDYSCVYIILHTEGDLVGHGLTFTCGRGNEIVARMIEAFEFLVVGQTLETFQADPVRRQDAYCPNERSGQVGRVSSTIG